MRLKFKRICLFSLLAFALLFFMACGGDSSVVDMTQGETMAEETPEAIEDWYSLPEGDYDGYEFNILYIDWSNYANGLYFNEEEAGDVLNGEVYKRQRAVEEQLNVKLNTTMTQWDRLFGQIKNAVAAGDDIYDFALTHCIAGVAPLAVDGLVLDFNRMEGFQLDKPWWNQNMNREMTIGGALLFGVSDYIIPEPNVIYFNKELQASYGMEDFYSIVREGKWTLDKFTELVKIPMADLNGDGVYDASDQYGLALSID